MGDFRINNNQNYKTWSKAPLFIVSLIFLLFVIYDFWGRPYILDDFGFTQIVQANGPINTMLDLGMNREGRFLSPFTLLNFTLIFLLSFNTWLVALVTFLISIFLIFRVLKSIQINLKCNILVSLICVIGLMVLVRPVALQTIFWQSGALYFLNFAYSIWALNFIHKHKARWGRIVVVLFVGFLTYQAVMAFLVMHLALRVNKSLTASRAGDINFKFDLLQFKPIQYFGEALLVVVPLLVTYWVGGKERVGMIEFNDTPYLLLRGYFYSFHRWVPIWGGYFLFVIFIATIVPESYGRNLFEQKNTKWLPMHWNLFIAGFFLAGILSILPTAIIRGYLAPRVSIYWAFFTSITLFFLVLRIKQKFKKNFDIYAKPILWLTIVLVLLIYIYRVEETKQFYKKLGDHLNEFVLRKEVVKKLQFKNYTDKELQTLYGYSDGEMIKINWLRDCYYDTYQIDSIRISHDKLFITYK